MGGGAGRDGPLTEGGRPFRRSIPIIRHTSAHWPLRSNLNSRG
jgi:hypothetical protein